MVLDWGISCLSDIEGNSSIKCTYSFSFLVGKHREPQSINAKPIIPIGIVAYASTLLWDNLCRNSCIRYSVILTSVAGIFANSNGLFSLFRIFLCKFTLDNANSRFPKSIQPGLSKIIKTNGCKASETMFWYSPTVLQHCSSRVPDVFNYLHHKLILWDQSAGILLIVLVHLSLFSWW